MGRLSFFGWIWTESNYVTRSQTHFRYGISGKFLIFFTFYTNAIMLYPQSKVFDAMFNGGLPEKNDPIEILDVQPEAFKALMEWVCSENKIFSVFAEKTKFSLQ